VDTHEVALSSSRAQPLGLDILCGISHKAARVPQRLNEPKPLIWRASSKSDFKLFPEAVQREMGYALFLAQMGERHPIMSKSLKGFGGGTTIDLAETHSGNAYRAVYTVRFSNAVYVLHAFQKKSKRGIKTPKRDLEIIGRRLRELVEERETGR
jgi:phage-related protein